MRLLSNKNGYPIGQIKNKCLLFLSSDHDSVQSLPTLSIKAMRLAIENDYPVLTPIRLEWSESIYFRSSDLKQIVLRYQKAIMYGTKKAGLGIIEKELERMEKEVPSVIYINNWIEKNKMKAILR